MNRRDALTSISMAGGASLIPSAESLAGALSPGASATFAQAVAGTAPVKIRDIKTILTAPTGIRLVVVKVETTEPGLVRLGLRHVHAARAGRPDGDRAVPEAVPHRPQRRRDRGHLAVVLRELVLAQRPGAVQRDERRRHRALGHQGQARRACRSTSCSAARCRHGADCYYHASGRDFAGGRGQRAHGHGARLPPRPRAGRRRPGYADLRRRAARRRPAAAGAGRADRPDQSAGDLGIGALRAHAAEALRAPAHQARRRGRAAARRARARAR